MLDRRHRARSRLHVGEPLLDHRARLRRIDIAGDHQARVGRLVVLPEELHHVLVAGGREVVHVADRRPVIRMPFRIQQRIDLDLRRSVRRVLDVLAALVLHHVALAVDDGGRHRVEEVAHPIRFEEEREVERVGRDVDVVVGAVRFRRGVVRAARALEQRVERPFLHVAGAFEHQVLEQVREPGPPGLLPRRPDVIPDVHRYKGDGVVLVQDHVQPVRQRELRIGDRNRSGAGRGCGSLRVGGADGGQ